MDHRKLSRVRLVVMTMIAVAGVALVAAHGFAGGASGNAGSGAAAVREAQPVTAFPATPADRVEAPASQAAAQGDESTAACKKEPQCSVDSDCDVICGVGLGKCVHASCPIRVCHCR